MNVLFVCYANIGRSQMAEAFFTALTTRHHAKSAGVAVQYHEGQPIRKYVEVVECMKSVGIDVSQKTSRQLTPTLFETADLVVWMTEKEYVPAYAQNSPKLLFWDVQDAGGQSYEFHCMTRDKIRRLVENLVRELS